MAVTNGDTKPFIIQQGEHKGTAITKKWVDKTFMAAPKHEKMLQQNTRITFSVLRKDYVPKGK